MLLISACTFNHPQLPEGFSNKFFWLPTQQRDAEFEKQDFDTQYKLYIYGSQEIEPPEMGLAWVLAKQGGKIVQPLEAKLEAADDDLTIRDILLVFVAMSQLETYDVPANKPLMQELLEKSGAIKDPSWAIVAQDDMHEITFKCKCELRK
ncbi:MAG: hypothetical protein WBP68_10505 [Candidatus Binatus sp.]